MKFHRPPGLRTVLALTLILATGLAIRAGASGSADGRASAATRGQAQQTGPALTLPRPPNIVFILTDDLSWNLINKRWAPHIAALEQQGETFSHYFVADSLCCPSRSTIFTGLFPHDTHVIYNDGPDGGYQKFRSEHLGTRTFAFAMHQVGYQASMLGKYLNGWGDPHINAKTGPIPPGWTDWHVANNTGYKEYNYALGDDGTVHHYGGPNAGGGPSGAPDAYGVDVMRAYARRFIATNAARPFIVEAATFAPHQPFTPARRNAHDFPDLTEPEDPSFDSQNVNPPSWLGQRAPLSPDELAQIEQTYRKRVRSVEAVDQLLAGIEDTLAAEHLMKNTYIVFSSDNGYHLGQHRLLRGKMTAFDTDIRVPLIVAGPGVPAGRTVTQVAQNTDLYPTFLSLAGVPPGPDVDGHSLVPLLHPSGTRPRWRTVALVEHAHSGDPNDPDYELGNFGGNPQSYTAIRISAPHLPTFPGPVEGLYVEYKDAQQETEYYDIAQDPYERDNIVSRLTDAQRAELHRVLTGLRDCHGTRACWRAARPS